MDQDEVRTFLSTEFNVSRETLDRLHLFVEHLKQENERQNLIARGTLGAIWFRHIYDSAQLLTHAPPKPTTWLDLGTGAGFPGLIIAALSGHCVTMVESRRLRVDFLTRAAELLQLHPQTRIILGRVERMATDAYGVISARAFAPLPELLALAERFTAPQTRWVLPKGRNAQLELDAVRASWQGEFHVEPSRTDPDAGIIIAERVARVSRGKKSR